MECDEGHDSCNLGIVRYGDYSTGNNPKLPLDINKLVIKQAVKGSLKEDDLENNTDENIYIYEDNCKAYVEMKKNYVRRQVEHRMSSEGEKVHVQFSEATDTRKSSCKVGVTATGESEPININVGGKIKDGEPRRSERVAKWRHIATSEDENDDITYNTEIEDSELEGN